MGASAAALLAAHERAWATSSDAKSAPSCVARPRQTEGPYFVDDKLNRSDIRSDPGNGELHAGGPLRLIFNVSRLSGAGCAALADAQVDVWHCEIGRASCRGRVYNTG